MQKQKETMKSCPFLITITDYLKNSISKISAKQMNSMMIEHYSQLRLLDEKSAWTIPALKDYHKTLLPGDLNAKKTNAFIDHMAEAALQNEYLVDFLNQAEKEEFKDYTSKLKAEGAVVFPDALAYAHVLERLNQVMRDDWKIIASLKEHWEVARKDAGIFKHMNLFEHSKLTTLESPIKKFLKIHQSGVVDPKFARTLLPVNIWEATLVDCSNGMFDNGYAGVVLARHKPGNIHKNDITGEGPTTFSEDGKALLFHLPLTKKWDDLYAVWNLAFVTSYNQPYIMMKLLIPSVNDYKENPPEYMYNRVLALYTHIHWDLIRRADYIEAGKDGACWPDRYLRKFFGKVNKESAKKYKAEVKALKKNKQKY